MKSAARTSTKWTHFLSIPIKSPEIISRFLEFKQQVINDKICNVEESIFTNELKLHITLVMTALPNAELIEKGVNILQECRETVIAPELEKFSTMERTIKVSGLAVMRDQPARARVVYAKIESDFVQEIAKKLSSVYNGHGLSEHRTDILLHSTLMNLRYQNTAKKLKHKKKHQWHFDARDLIERFKNFDFGVETFEEIHLSALGEVGDDGYYKAAGVISISEKNNSE